MEVEKPQLNQTLGNTRKLATQVITPELIPGRNLWNTGKSHSSLGIRRETALVTEEPNLHPYKSDRKLATHEVLIKNLEASAGDTKPKLAVGTSRSKSEIQSYIKQQKLKRLQHVNQKMSQKESFECLKQKRLQQLHENQKKILQKNLKEKSKQASLTSLPQSSETAPAVPVKLPIEKSSKLADTQEKLIKTRTPRELRKSKIVKNSGKEKLLTQKAKSLIKDYYKEMESTTELKTTSVSDDLPHSESIKSLSIDVEEPKLERTFTIKPKSVTFGEHVVDSEAVSEKNMKKKATISGRESSQDRILSFINTMTLKLDKFSKVYTPENLNETSEETHQKLDPSYLAQVKTADALDPNLDDLDDGDTESIVSQKINKILNKDVVLNEFTETLVEEDMRPVTPVEPLTTEQFHQELEKIKIKIYGEAEKKKPWERHHLPGDKYSVVNILARKMKKAGMIAEKRRKITAERQRRKPRKEIRHEKPKQAAEVQTVAQTEIPDLQIKIEQPREDSEILYRSPSILQQESFQVKSTTQMDTDTETFNSLSITETTQNDRMSPNALATKLISEMQYNNALEAGLNQITNLKFTNNVINAQNETAAIAMYMKEQERKQKEIDRRELLDSRNAFLQKKQERLDYEEKMMRQVEKQKILHREVIESQPIKPIQQPSRRSKKPTFQQKISEPTVVQKTVEIDSDTEFLRLRGVLITKFLAMFLPQILNCISQSLFTL